LGSTNLQQKKYAQAAARFKRVLARNPQSQAANYNLGLIALVRERPSEALTYFQAVNAANPRDVPALVGILECRLLR
jgi:predicted Zn-dependent protease